jgi:hypothetical protein
MSKQKYLKNMRYIAMNQPWTVLNFGTSGDKPLEITVKKAVEKYINSKIKNICLM